VRVALPIAGFEQVLAGVRDDDRVAFTSVAGLPGWGQFCVDQQLAAAQRGDPKKGSSSAAWACCRSARRSARCAT
jgi:hypothetical protein